MVIDHYALTPVSVSHMRLLGMAIRPPMTTTPVANKARINFRLSRLLLVAGAVADDLRTPSGVNSKAQVMIKMMGKEKMRMTAMMRREPTGMPNSGNRVSAICSNNQQTTMYTAAIL